MIDLKKIETSEVVLNKNKDIVFDSHVKKINIKTSNFIFETLYIPNNNSKELMVLLSSGGRLSRDTRFDRWSMYGYCNKNILCIEDPMYKLHKMVTGWYFGTKEHSALVELKLIIDRVLTERNILKKDLCIIGSSCAGYAAIYLTNLIQGCLCIAMNPQIIISNFGKSSVTLGKRVQMSLETDIDPFKRNDITYFTEDKRSKYFIMSNKLVKRDWNQQIFILFEKIKPSKIDFSENLYTKDNIILYLSNNAYSRAHGNSIDSLELVYLSDILKHESCNFVAIQSIMNVQEKKWEINDQYVNLIFWEDLFKNVCLGNYLRCPVIEKNKLTISNQNYNLKICICGKAKNSILTYQIRFEKEDMYKLFNNLFEQVYFKILGLKEDDIRKEDNIIFFSSSENLKDKFVNVIGIVNSFLSLYTNHVMKS